MLEHRQCFLFKKSLDVLFACISGLLETGCSKHTIRAGTKTATLVIGERKEKGFHIYYFYLKKILTEEGVMQYIHAKSYIFQIPDML